MKKLLVLIAILFSFAACTPTQQQFALDSSMILVESEALKTKYAKVELLIRNIQKEKHMFSNDEWRSLLNVDASIDMLIARIDNMMKFNTNNVQLSDVTFLWGMAVQAYGEGRSVIYAHWDEFTPSTQLLLNSFDVQAEMTGNRISELLNNPSNQNMTQALTLITGIVSIAVKMLGVAVL